MVVDFIFGRGGRIRNSLLSPEVWRRLFVCLFVGLAVCLSVLLSVCLSVSLFADAGLFARRTAR